jgi:hypothetical protein
LLSGLFYVVLNVSAAPQRKSAQTTAQFSAATAIKPSENNSFKKLLPAT